MKRLNIMILKISTVFLYFKAEIEVNRERPINPSLQAIQPLDLPSIAYSPQI